MADVPLQVVSDNAAGERRITPSWTIGQLKAKLEPITGIPPLSQKLSLKVPGSDAVAIEAADEENTRLASFPLTPYAELHVSRVPWAPVSPCHNHNPKHSQSRFGFFFHTDVKEFSSALFGNMDPLDEKDQKLDFDDVGVGVGNNNTIGPLYLRLSLTHTLISHHLL